MQQTDTSPLSALHNSGTIKKSETLRQIINGVQTITPVITHLIEIGVDGNPGVFSKTLTTIKNLQMEILKKATELNYDITPLHYVAINRLSLQIVCSTEYNVGVASDSDIAMWCSEMFDMDDIYADSMLEEFTDDDFALQFMAVSELASVITRHMIKTGNTESSDDATAELMRETIELVDSHIDNIYEQFISPLSATHIRSHLIKQSSLIMKAILAKSAKNNPHNTNTSLISKQFELAYKNYIEAVTINAEVRG